MNADDQPILRNHDRECISTITATHHFRAKHADGGAKVRIDQVEVIDSNLPERQLRLILAWAELHQHELLENWR